MKRLGVLCTVLSALVWLSPAFADEGMWMVNLIDKALAAKMSQAGSRISPEMIYDDSRISLSDAVVSIDFECTASMVSKYGLLMTNHHCAQADLVAISTPDNNYLETGFWAMDMSEEIPLSGRKAYFLKYVIDVTDEVMDFMASAAEEGKVVNPRRMHYIMESAVSEQTGYAARLTCVWGGEKYYMSLYDVYADVRLVGVPAANVAGFGGDTDNWTWPQHKADFAIYRVYTAVDGSPAEYSADNVPMASASHFVINPGSVSDGDFTLVLGYPAVSGRYKSSWGVNHEVNLLSPISLKLRSVQLEIMSRRMRKDPEVALKYSDIYFNISNSLKYDVGEMNNVREYSILDSLRSRERRIMAWMTSKGAVSDTSVCLLDELLDKYVVISELERNREYYYETFVRGSRMNALVNSLKVFRGDSPKEQSVALCGSFMALSDRWNDLDAALEKELLEYSVSEFYANVDTLFWSPYHQYLYVLFGEDRKEMTDYVWENSFFTNTRKYDSLRTVIASMLEDGLLESASEDGLNALKDAVGLYYDPMFQLLQSQNMARFNVVLSEIEEGVSVQMLEREYLRTIYRMGQDIGLCLYPDADRSMRFSYGKVCGMCPKDGVIYRSVSTVGGLLDKYASGSEDYVTSKDYLDRLMRVKREMPVNFTIDNDVAPGNSGSPVLDSDGRMVGLVFDAAQEALAGSLYYMPQKNRCICVDAGFILWVIGEYAGWLLDEMDVER